jgi:hypothetical protein
MSTTATLPSATWKGSGRRLRVYLRSVIAHADPWQNRDSAVLFEVRDAQLLAVARDQHTLGVARDVVEPSTPGVEFTVTVRAADLHHLMLSALLGSDQVTLTLSPAGVEIASDRTWHFVRAADSELAPTDWRALVEPYINGTAPALVDTAGYNVRHLDRFAYLADEDRNTPLVLTHYGAGEASVVTFGDWFLGLIRPVTPEYGKPALTHIAWSIALSTEAGSGPAGDSTHEGTVA